VRACSRAWSLVVSLRDTTRAGFARGATPALTFCARNPHLPCKKAFSASRALGERICPAQAKKRFFFPTRILIALNLLCVPAEKFEPVLPPEKGFQNILLKAPCPGSQKIKIAMNHYYSHAAGKA